MKQYAHIDAEGHVIETGDELSQGPRVGDRAPEFYLEGLRGRLKLSELAARFDKLVLVSQDSYQFHSG
jgi:hypothetical protein